MSTPTAGSPYEFRVLVEVVVAGVPRRVQVWQLDGATYVSFAVTTSEDDATALVLRGLAVLKQLDLAALFAGPGLRRRRFIEPN